LGEILRGDRIENSLYEVWWKNWRSLLVNSDSSWRRYRLPNCLCAKIYQRPDWSVRW
jgi:hypothetical protein